MKNQINNYVLVGVVTLATISLALFTYKFHRPTKEKYVALAQYSIDRTVKITVHAITSAKHRIDIGGSGAVFSEKGHIITANHLFTMTYSSISVRFSGRSVDYEGKVILQDKKTDLALIKISTPTPKVFQLERYGQVKIGQEVLAVGHPLGLDWTVTHGIISQTRDLGLTYTQYIQTDAAINMGNSGGPLVNLDRKLIGINSHIYTPSFFPVNSGIAMAASVDAVHYFLGGLPYLEVPVYEVEVSHGRAK